MDEVVQSIHKLFESLGKCGKPKNDEWTCLAAFVLEVDCVFTVVSLSTGSKCIGANAMDEGGLVVNDSHAEVLARRNLLRYLYDQLRINRDNQTGSIFEKRDGKFTLKGGAKFHFYCSQVPCGDASIIPMEPKELEIGFKRKGSNFDNTLSKKAKNDVHRTGAKPLPGETKQDPKNIGGDYHIRGAVRTKPGRGDPTKSLSCSDKIAKWLFCGLQGALLSFFIDKPIKLSSIIIGGCGPFDASIFEDAVVRRSGLADSPKIMKSNLVFKHSPDGTERKRPCPASIQWANVGENKLQVSVEGRRLGFTKKSKGKAYLLTSKYALFNTFHRLSNDSSLRKMTYGSVKQMASNYQTVKIRFIAAMGCWSEDKLKYEEFCAE